MDRRTDTYVISQLAFELGHWLHHWNTENRDMSKARDAIRDMRGAVGRVTDEILKAKADIDAAEREAIDLTGSAKGAQFKELGAIKGELREIINDLKDVSNGAPDGPLPGEVPSAGFAADPQKPSE